jgi:hypothetical protein
VGGGRAVQVLHWSVQRPQNGDELKIGVARGFGEGLAEGLALNRVDPVVDLGLRNSLKVRHSG